MKIKSSSLKLMSSVLISSLLNTSFAGQFSELILEDQEKALAYISKKRFITELTEKKALDLLNFYSNTSLRDSITVVHNDIRLKSFSASVKEQSLLKEFINLDEIGHNQAKKRNFWGNLKKGQILDSDSDLINHYVSKIAGYEKFFTLDSELHNNGYFNDPRNSMLKVALKLQEKYNRASLIGHYIQKTNLSITGFSAIQGLMQEKIDFSQIRATIIDESFYLPNFNFLPNSNYSNAIDSDQHMKMSNKSYHGDSILQSFIQPFKNISLEKTKLIPVTAIHNSQIRDTNLCQEIAPSLHPQGVINCSFSFSYADFQCEENKNRIKENYEIITKQSDQLLIQAGGNSTKTLDQDIQYNHDALFNHYVENPDLLECTIFVGNFNIISHSIDKSSNLAGSYDQHYILAPGAVQSHSLPGTFFNTAFENGGTSCAAPLVTAGASMLRACFPWADSKTIKHAIISTGNKDIQGYTPALHGAGLLNMQGAFYYLQNLENTDLKLASRL